MAEVRQEDGMTIFEAMQETVKKARSTGRVYYLYKSGVLGHDWDIEETYFSDWTFKAYPGGRKVLSKWGACRVRAAQKGESE